MKLERYQSRTQARQREACDPVLHDGPRRNVLWLMAEYFRTLGFSNVKARLPGHMAPEMLNGTLEDHRPDLTCRQHDRGRTPVFLEVVVGEELDEPGTENRWSLLASAARLYSAELHFVVPRWSTRGSIDRRLRRRLSDMDVHPNHIWKV
jgi:hypothetical protein